LKREFFLSRISELKNPRGKESNFRRQTAKSASCVKRKKNARQGRKKDEIIKFEHKLQRQ
jgi:hypothetical protein